MPLLTTSATDDFTATGLSTATVGFSSGAPVIVTLASWSAAAPAGLVDDGAGEGRGDDERPRGMAQRTGRGEGGGARGGPFEGGCEVGPRVAVGSPAGDLATLRAHSGRASPGVAHRAARSFAATSAFVTSPRVRSSTARRASVVRRRPPVMASG